MDELEQMNGLGGIEVDDDPDRALVRLWGDVDASLRDQASLAMVALGLGQTIVQGGTALQFSPATPSVLPQFGSPQDYLRFTQRRFFALDLSRPKTDFAQGSEASLVQVEIADAEAENA